MNGDLRWTAQRTFATFESLNRHLASEDSFQPSRQVAFWWRTASFLLFRSRAALSAEVLFLRKQLAFYEERQVQPRRLNDSARFSVILWSRLCNVSLPAKIVTNIKHLES